MVYWLERKGCLSDIWEVSIAQDFYLSSTNEEVWSYVEHYKAPTYHQSHYIQPFRSNQYTFTPTVPLRSTGLPGLLPGHVHTSSTISRK